jgi:hypothetical protein
MKLALPFLLAAALLAQDPPKPAPAKPTPPRSSIQPYEKLITKEAKTQKGLFLVHRIANKNYFEIPASALGKEMLIVVSFKSNSTGLGYGGTEIANRVVVWERKDTRILLREVSHLLAANSAHPISRAVKASSERTIIMSFPIEALGEANAPVIDVTRLFSSEVPEFSARRQLGARGFDPSRSFIERINAFPENINVEAAHTFTYPDSPVPTSAATPSRGPRGMRPGTNATIVAAYSLVHLPENPMKPRLYDDRLGFFNIRQVDYSSPLHRVSDRRFIARWRLEKKDPRAPISEPVKPIVYYIDPATPPQWIPFVKKGIEDWQPAFEAAGFRNAILAKDPPKDDPNFSLEDVRHSSVRWLPSDIPNAYGPSIRDPRTGEILESDIKMYHNILELQRDWYFTQVGHLDKRAQKLPMPDSLMGELIRFVVAHEVGHTLGLPHNFKASSGYTVAQVRDPRWVRQNGHTPTLMDYARFNYVAQPEDGIPVEDLIPKIGPYDIFAIKWGYSPIDNAATPEAELPTLHAWLKPQETTPWLRFSLPTTVGVDPGDQSESVADSDPVLATTLGIRNLKRVLDLVPNAYPADGDTFEDFAKLYDAVLGQWRREVSHVAALAGGLDTNNLHWGQSGPVYSPIPKPRQKAAVQFLAAEVLDTPRWLLRPDITNRTEPQGALNRLARLQYAVLAALLAPDRLQRMMEMEATHGAAAYAPAEYLTDLRQAIFAEWARPQPKIDPYRRNLQRLYLRLLDERVNRATPAAAALSGPMQMRLLPLSPVDDSRALLRAQLRWVQATAKLRAPSADPVAAAHLLELADLAGAALDPKSPPAAAPSAPRPAFDLLNCWPAASWEAADPLSDLPAN